MVEKVELCKVLYKFETTEDGEISLEPNTLVQVLGQVNDDWLTGYNGGRSGDFPAAFVERLAVFSLPSKGRLFVCVEPFPELQPGDLAMLAGDVVVGLEQLNDDWWRGHISGEVGIFPLTHVSVIDLKPQTPTTAVAAVAAPHDDSQEQVLYQVRAVIDSLAQLDDELSFSAGDIIHVTKEQDSDWLIGECNGKTGMFLKDLTEPMGGPHISSNHVIPSVQIQPELTKSVVSHIPSAQGTSSVQDKPVVADGKALYNFHAESSAELSLVKGQIVTNIRQVDEDWSEGSSNGLTGIFPSTFVEVVNSNGCSLVKDKPTVSPSTSISLLSALHTDVRVLYDFTAANEDEVTLAAGDLVDVVEHDVNDWSRVRTRSGQRGLCPASFLDLQATASPSEVNGVKELSVSNGNLSQLCGEHVNEVVSSCPSKTASSAAILGLDAVISMEMAKARSDGEKRWSLVDKPTASPRRPATPTKPSAPARPSSPLKPTNVTKPTPADRSVTSTKPPDRSVISTKPPDRPVTPTKAPNRSVTPTKPPDRSVTSTKPPDRPVTPTKAPDRSVTPTKAPERSVTPTKPPDRPVTLTKPPDRPVTPTKPPDRPVTPTKPPDRPVTPTKAPNRSVTPTKAPDRSVTPTKPPDRPVTPTKPPDRPVTSTKPLIPEVPSTKPATKAPPLRPSTPPTNPALSPKSANGVEMKPDRPKPARPSSTIKQPSSTDSTSGLVSPYDKIKEPFESHMEWRDEHPAPIITRRSAEKPLPVKPPPPKRSASNSHLPVTNEDAADNLTAQQPMKSSDSTHESSKIEQSITVEVETTEQPVKTPDTAVEQPITVADTLPVLKDQEKTTDAITNSVSSAHPASDLDTAAPPPVRLAPTRPAPSRPAPSRPAPSRPAPSRPAPTRPAPSPVESGPAKPVPTRPAPSLPAGAKPVPVRAAPKPPVLPTIVEPVAAYDDHAANELREKIASLERDIENYNTQIENMNGVDNGELEEKLQYCVENINGLTIEVDELKAKLNTMESSRKASTGKRSGDEEVRSPRPVPDVNSAENIEKRRVKRVNKIKELIDSEQFYLRDLTLCMQVFNSSSGLQAPEGMDKTTLFCNMSDVIELSEKLLNQLQSCIDDVTFDQQVIGTPFISLKESMKEVYAFYCKNYDDVSSLLEQYKGSEEIRMYFSQGLEEIAKHRKEKPFTIDAFLITPVQRIPRYILFLSELFEATEASHPDKFKILEAKAAQEEVAVYINEYKRRKDLVNKYKVVHREDEDRLTKLNMHSIRKKTARMGRKIGNLVGLSFQYVDKDFDREAAVCKDLENSIRDFTRNIDSFLSSMRRSHDMKEAVATDLSEYMSTLHSEEVKQYLLSQQTISSVAFKQFRREVEGTVCTNLLQLLALFQGPSKLIMKRGDKRLDFDAAHSKYEKNKEDKVVMEELDRAKKDFEALNTQLKEELPKFNGLVYDIFRDNITQLTHLYQLYFDECYKSVLPIMQVRTMDSSMPLMEGFDRGYATSVELLCPSKARKLSESRLSAVIGPHLGQTAEIKQQLSTKYPATNLYKVTSDHSSSDPLELRLFAGDVVGVIQKKDPMGNEERWYADNGAAAMNVGFVPRNILQPVGEDSVDVGSVASPTATVQAQAIPSSPPPAYDSIQNPFPFPEKHEVYQAIYDFTPRNSNELSVTARQIVHVHRKHDEQGNTDWWYSESNSGFGYVPASYLAPASEH